MDVINMDKINELRLGLETAYIDGSVASDSFLLSSVLYRIIINLVRKFYLRLKMSC